MKNHIFRLNFQLHAIKINVSFPCTVSATVQIDNDYKDICDGIDIKQAAISTNASIEKEISMIFNERTQVHSIKKATITFYLHTKSGKLQAGASTLFLNKMTQGCVKQTIPISKCSDRQANFQYSLGMQLLDELNFQTKMTTSVVKDSSFDGYNQDLSSSQANFAKKFYQQGSLYQSIVREQHDGNDKFLDSNGWQKRSNVSRGSNGNNSSFISMADMKHIQSSKVLNSYRSRNDGSTSFRKSRLEGSMVSQVRHNQRSFINSSNGRLNQSKVYGQQEDTKIVLQKKVQQLQKRVEDQQKDNRALKHQLSEIKDQWEQKLRQQLNKTKQLQISESSLRQELNLSKQKYLALQQQSNKMMFETNDMLNKYANKNQDMSSVKMRERQLIEEKNKLIEKLQKSEKTMEEQASKYLALEQKVSDDIKQYQKNIKKYQFYQKEVMELDQRLSEQKNIEQELRTILQKKDQELAVYQQTSKKEIQKSKKLINETKQFQNQQKTAMNRQIQQLNIKLQESKKQIQKLQKDITQANRDSQNQLGKAHQQLKQLQKTVQKLQEDKKKDSQNISRLTNTLQLMEDKIKSLQQQAELLVEEKDAQLNDLEAKLDELNIQQMGLNQQTYDLESQLARVKGSYEDELAQNQSLSKQICVMSEKLVEKQIHFENLLDDFQNYKKKAQQNFQSKGSIVAELSDKISLLQGNLAQLKVTLSKKQVELQQQIEMRQTQSIDYQNKIQQKQLQLEEANNKINEIQAAMIQSSNQAYQKSSKSESLAIQVKTVLNQNESLKMSKEELIKQIQEKSSIIDQIQGELTSAYEQVKSLTEENIKLKTNLSCLEKVTDNCCQVVEIFCEDVKQIIDMSLNKKVNTPVNSKQTVKKNINKDYYKKSINSSRKRKEIQSPLTNQITTILKEIQTYSQNQSTQINTLEIEIQSQRSNTKKLENKLIQANNQIIELDTTLQQIEQNQKNLRQDNKLLALDRVSAQKKINQYQKKLQELQSKYAKSKDSQAQIIRIMRVQITQKNKEIQQSKKLLAQNNQYLKQTEHAYHSHKDRMQIQLNKQLNQFKSQLIDSNKKVLQEQDNSKKKQQKIDQLSKLNQKLKTNQTKQIKQKMKQISQLQRQLQANKKRQEKNTIQKARNNQIMAQLHKKIEGLTENIKQMQLKHQQAYREISNLNKKIVQSQNIIRDKVNEISKLKVKLTDMEKQNAKFYMEKQQKSAKLQSIGFKDERQMHEKMSENIHFLSNKLENSQFYLQSIKKGTQTIIKKSGLVNSQIKNSAFLRIITLQIQKYKKKILSRHDIDEKLRTHLIEDIKQLQGKVQDEKLGSR